MAKWPKPSLLTLGTAVFGMPYGVANPPGQPPPAAVEAMLDQAWAAGVTTFDTAPAYGDAEDRLGRWVRRRGVIPHVATKLPSLADVPDSKVALAINDAIRSSTGRLGLPPATYLTHDAADYLRPAIREHLHAAAAHGHVGAVGLSAYTDVEVFAAIKAGPPQAIQIPVSVLDQRMIDSGALAVCAASGVTVFARSIFLQGAILMAADQMPAALQAILAPLARLDAICAEMRSTRASLALRFVRDLSGVSSTVIGAYSSDQLEALIAVAHEPPLTSAHRAAITAVSNGIPAEAVDPRRWPNLAQAPSRRLGDP